MWKCHRAAPHADYSQILITILTIDQLSWRSINVKRRPRDGRTAIYARWVTGQLALPQADRPLQHPAVISSLTARAVMCVNHTQCDVADWSFWSLAGQSDCQSLSGTLRRRQRMPSSWSVVRSSASRMWLWYDDDKDDDDDDRFLTSDWWSLISTSRCAPEMTAWRLRVGPHIDRRSTVNDVDVDQTSNYGLERSLI